MSDVKIGNLRTGRSSAMSDSNSGRWSQILTSLTSVPNSLVQEVHNEGDGVELKGSELTLLSKDFL
jgi:hypothetical protein